MPCTGDKVSKLQVSSMLCFRKGTYHVTFYGSEGTVFIRIETISSINCDCDMLICGLVHFSAPIHARKELM
jgi:hypothetical protein